MSDKFLSMLGIARKAGAAVPGFDKAKECMSRRSARVIFVCSDISEKTRKELCFFAKRANIGVITSRFNMFDFSCAVGSKTGIVTVTDSGIASKLTELSGESFTADGTLRKD